MVVVSSGFHRTHVTIAAREASVRGNLELAITGAYPTRRLKRVVHALRFDRVKRVARLLEREEGIPEAELRPLFLPEMLDELARLWTRIPIGGRLYRVLSAGCMRLYGLLAARELEHSEAAVSRVYHFRAGFGHASIDRARRRGMVALCDHAAVHPTLTNAVVKPGWSLAEAAPTPPPDPVARAILADVERADAVVVNSGFIRDMFLDLGYPAERLHVVHLGVDDSFLRYASRAVEAPSGQPRLMYAGRFDRAKGADVLIESLARLTDMRWELVIAGPVGRDIAVSYPDFLADRRVSLLGTIDRARLAMEMKLAPVFVFPSPSEGSARVVFEALACGSYVITTPSAGSIVEDGVHGALVAPGDPVALGDAIADALRGRELVLEIGRRNANLIARRFTQSDYGDALARLYDRLSDQASRNAQSSTLVAPNSG